MPRHAAVAVDDDLAAGQAAVADRSADDEIAGRVDVEPGVLAEPLPRQHVLDHQFHHRLAQVLQLDVRIVLRRQHHGVEAGDLAVLVAAGDLRLGVRAQPG
jgi:hypothetical protein